MGLAAGRNVWVVLPTYNEIDNLEPMLAAADERVEVLHREAKEGLGAAYRAGFRQVLEHPDVRAVVQMDADFSHDPTDLPRLLAPLMGGADLVLGARYVPGGGTVGWPWYRQLISRGGTTFARTILLLPYRDLTGGFKAWRRELLEAIRLRDVGASGYGFQVETTWWAHRRGARIVQIPIVFRERVAGDSKMTGGIVREALLRVLALRWQATVGALRRRGPS